MSADEPDALDQSDVAGQSDAMDQPDVEDQSDVADGPVDDAPVGAWRRSRLDVAAGVVLVTYALWVTLQLGASVVGDEAFDALARQHAGVVGRMLLSIVVLAALWHTAQGALALLAGPWPAVRRHEGPARQVCAFVTLAAGIPAVTVVLWPVVAGIPT